jgi:transcriptional regulator with XRE-family HTH domain
MLRQRLGISQERLADMIGTEVTGSTVCRWEKGALMPYPAKRDKLARIANKNGMEHIAALFTTPWPLEEWLAIGAINAPESYPHILMLDILAANAFQFNCPDEGENYNKWTDLLTAAEGLFNRLVQLQAAGEEIFIPPSVHHRRFWVQRTEDRDAEKTEGSR